MKCSDNLNIFKIVAVSLFFSELIENFEKFKSSIQNQQRKKYEDLQYCGYQKIVASSSGSIFRNLRRHSFNIISITILKIIRISKDFQGKHAEKYSYFLPRYLIQRNM